MIGKKLGRYLIMDKIGQGGMGQVFLARDTSLDRNVALKFLPQDLQSDPTARERLLREAKSAATLDHPHICVVHETGEAEGIPFIVMEYVAGESLKEKLSRGPLPLEEALRLGAEIAEALDVAHSKNIIHRDLKPANVMVTRNGHVKVMDFGLAKRFTPSRGTASQDETLAELTEVGTTVGTPAYMSPEQLLGRTVDKRSDVFAFGILLYEMLTGVHPFRKDVPLATATAILSEEPAPLEAKDPTIPPQLEELIKGMLAKTYEQRLESMHEIRERLQEIFLQSRSGSIAPSRPVATPRVRPVLKLAVVACLIVLAALAVWWVRGYYFLAPSSALGFQARDWILISDFENLTGDPVFDKSLDTALRVSIEQSSYVNVFPRHRVMNALQRMKKPGVTRIDEVIGREIAEREGVKALLVPSITGVGTTYMLTASLEDPKTGRGVTSEIARAEGKEKVLDALDELTGGIRHALGESLAKISEQGRPLAEVTTSSLEALKQYSLGIESHTHSKLEEAKSFYASALQEDPGFTAALASLGMINFEHFDREEGKKLLARAVTQVNDLTEREKNGILAFHASAVENNPEKAVQYWKALIALYPDDSAAQNNLAYLYRNMGRYEDAVSAYKEAIRIDPTFMISYDELNAIYIHLLGELEPAIELCKKQLQVNDQELWPHANLGWIYLGKGNFIEARKELEKAIAIDPRSTLNLFRLAHAYRLLKDYANALATLERIPKVNPNESISYDLGVIYQLMGNQSEMRRQFETRIAEIQKQLRATPKSPYVYLALAGIRARMGQPEDLKLPAGVSPPDQPDWNVELAGFYSAQGKIAECVDQLQTAIKKGYRNYVWMKVKPDMQNALDDPRFQALMDRVMK